MKETELKVLIIEPMKKPREAMIPNTLEAMQNIVGGYIEVMSIRRDGTVIVCNEEGKITGLPMNRALWTNGQDNTRKISDIICGTFIVCGVKDDEFVSLDEWQLKAYKATFETPEKFIRNKKGQIICVEHELFDEE